MPATTSTFVSPPRQSQPARPRTPPADIHDSTPSSPTNTIPSSSSHSHQTQVSSSLATDTAASSPDIISTSLPYITSALEPPKGFVPAPSFSIARAPRYPGWRPELETGLGAPPASPNKRTSVYMKPGGGIGSQTPPTTSPPYSPSAKDSIPPLPSLATIIPPTPSPKFIPKKPLSPKHLIRIANALGVQIPTPIGGGLGDRSASLPRSVSNGASPSSPSIRRPSSANSNRGINQRGVVNSATRFLLYIVPPSHLTADLVGNAGLANQFRRGSLLPLHATLPSQLNAIAREYSLPSTQGLVVYLLDIKHDVLGDEAQPIGEEWLGPRIGEDSWRILWSGMIRAERETFERTMALQRQALSPAPSPSPRLPPSNSAPSNLVNGNSSPAESVDSLPGSSGEASPQQSTNPPRSASLRPLWTEQLQQEAAQRASSPFFSHTRSETMRSDSPSLSSIKTTTSAVSPLLPSLPIVGKIEFDIDRSKATWYDNWAKRPRSRTASTGGRGNGGSERMNGGSRSPLIPLQLGTIPPIVGSTTGKSPGRKLPPSPLQPVSPHLDVEAAQPSSNLLTPASAGFFGGNSSNSRSSTSLSSDADEEEHNAVPRDSLLLVAQEPEKREEEEEDSAQDDQSGVVGGVGYEPLADELSEKEEEEDNRLSDNEGPFDEDPTQSGQSEDGDVPSSSREAPDGRDPLGDVFPSDGETWSGIHTEMTDNTAVSPTSDSRMHPDRADYLGRTSEDSDFTEELPLADSNADDFQEVLDLLNAKQQQPDLAVQSPTKDSPTEILPEELPSQVPASVLRSPIILDEHKPDSSEPEFLPSPESTTSMESIRGRRPAPLILGPSDKIPSILEGLQPTPPGRHSLTLDTAFTEDPSTPQPERNSTISSDGGDYDDEYTQEKEMKRQLDELERSISSLSPRELSPLPLVTERSPAGRSRNGTPIHSLNGVNGPRFRSEALGVELAHKLAAGYAPSNGSRDASPHWPAVPFEKSSPMFTSSPNSNTSIRTESISGGLMSEETRVRSHLQAEEDQLAASRKYRPPTPANKDGPPAESTPPLSVLTTMPPIPMAPRISSVSSPKNSSRFSADSAVSEENGRGTSVVGRSLRKLWRKSGAAAQASARLSAGAKQSAGRNPGKEDAPPPMPQTNSSVQPGALRQELRAERPDSGQDPFFFDQQSPYPTFRTISPSMYQQAPYRDPQAARAQAPAPAPAPASTANKTRSILKGRRASPPAQETPQAEVREKSKGFFPSRRSNTNDQASPPPGQSDQHGGLNVSRSDSRDGDASGNKSKKSPPPGLVTPDNSLQTGGQNLSPSAFPRTASRSSFDAEETAFRPSMDSGDPLTPRLSQFEIVSPRGKSFELEEDRRAQVNGSR